MTSSNSQHPYPHVQVDMHTGPAFDAEIYLALERELFKVEPRPIPRPGKLLGASPPPQTMTRRFIEMARKVAYKLDDILRAPFEHFATKKNAERNGQVSGGDQNSTVTPGQENTRPPTVYISENTESTRNPYRQKDGIVRSAEERMRQADINEKFPVIRNGHVSSLIKLYEDVSDVTSEGSARGPRNAVSPKAQQVDAKPRSPLLETQVINTSCKAWKSGRRVTFCEEKNVIYVEGSNQHRRNGGGTRDNARNGRTERRVVQLRFCGLRLGGTRR